MMKRNIGAALIALSVEGVAACGNPGVTDSEKEERQSLAFDVAGNYVEDRSASPGTPAALQVVDESGVTNIMATLQLRGGLATSDQQQFAAAIRQDDPALKDADVSPVVSQIEAALADAQLSVGPTFTERGGENVALDHTGDVDEIALRTTVSPVAQTADGTYNATVSLFMTAHKGAGRLTYETTPYTDDDGRGANGEKGLLVTLTRTAPSQDGGEVTTITSELQLSLGEMVKY